ncbi:nucleotidyltransferase [Candidatus Marinimicrobia bacterium]|nr:nucleotidyltransferase [Candidatus Neomarinimicrobiota bacterium]
MSRRVNIIPMAGDGRRFKDEGFKTPKPFIQINGLPMVIRAAQCLPKADYWIFIAREKHLKSFDFKKVLSFYFSNFKIIVLNELSGGQLSTCLTSRNYLNSDDILTFGACDNSMIYDRSKYENILTSSDSIIWTFRNNISVMQDPDMYGWVVSKDGISADTISCKKSISNDPISDHAIVGTFSFKNADIFLENADRLIKKNRRVNNEYYLDLVIDEVILSGMKVKIFEINKYICWGTPKDLNNYISDINQL